MGKAKDKFDRTITRCYDLVNLYEKMKSNGESPPQDMLRGAIVLSVAAFDAYATDCFSEHFVEYIKSNRVDDQIVKLLSDAGFDIRFALGLIDSERPYRKIRTLIERYYSRKSTQKMDVVDELFLLYHLKNITGNAAAKSGKDSQKLIKGIEKLVERRHQIVHDGDYNEHNRITPVSQADIKRIRLLRLLVDNMEEIVNNKFAK